MNYTAKDIRFTTKHGVVYAFLLDVPVEKVSISALPKMAGHGLVEKVELLGTNEAIKWSQNIEALEIAPSKHYPSSDAVCYKITLRTSSEQETR